MTRAKNFHVMKRLRQDEWLAVEEAKSESEAAWLWRQLRPFYAMLWDELPLDVRRLIVCDAARIFLTRRCVLADRNEAVETIFNGWTTLCASMAQPGMITSGIVATVPRYSPFFRVNISCRREWLNLLNDTRPDERIIVSYKLTEDPAIERERQAAYINKLTFD
jgi:hypothetical protein